MHGQPVADPYRWLEDGADPEVEAWVAAQNELTHRTLASSPSRARIHARLLELLAVGTVSRPAPTRLADGTTRCFHAPRRAGRRQPALLVRDGDGADRVLLDPEALDPDANLALDWFEPAPSGELVCVGTSRGGTESSTLEILDATTGARVDQPIPHTRAASIAWLPDLSGFFYTRYPEPRTVPPGEEHYHRRLLRHHIGDLGPDLEVFTPEDPTGFTTCQVSPDGRWLIVTVHHGWAESEIHLAELTSSGLAFVRITPADGHRYEPLAVDGLLYVSTTAGAPRGKLLAIDPEHPEPNAWRLVAAEHPSDVLGPAVVIGGDLFLAYSRGGRTRITRLDSAWVPQGDVPLDAPGTIDGLAGAPRGHELYFDFESFVQPRAILRFDMRTGVVTTWAALPTAIDTTRLRVREAEAVSRDGARITYFVVHDQDVDLGAGNLPTLLQGYGGFNVPVCPRFSATTLAFVELGGVVVHTQLRGGGEHGDEWHRAGQREHKQNTFDDFIAVAEALVADGLTRPERLAIHGRSNGGLLVAAATTQRPELFRAAVIGVPLTDMLRYHRFLLARLWIPEYGSAEAPDAFAWLYAYSPYHRVREGTEYPACLVTTAAGDSRVDPLHARKLVAALQHATSSGRPVLLRTEVAAGHGAGKPTTLIADEYADLYAFVLAELGAE